jgi:hypothetical protein
MRGQDFRRARPSRLMLPSLGVGKINQALNLRNGQGRKTLAEFVDSLPKVVAVDNGIGRMRVPRTMGLPETLPEIFSISSQPIQSMSESASTFAMFLPSFHRSFLSRFGGRRHAETAASRGRIPRLHSRCLPSKPLRLASSGAQDGTDLPEKFVLFIRSIWKRASALLWPTFLERAELAGAGVCLHLLQ